MLPINNNDFTMSSSVNRPSLETGSYKPDNLETGSNKPEQLETGSNQPDISCEVEHPIMCEIPTAPTWSPSFKNRLSALKTTDYPRLFSINCSPGIVEEDFSIGLMNSEDSDMWKTDFEILSEGTMFPWWGEIANFTHHSDYMEIRRFGLSNLNPPYVRTRQPFIRALDGETPMVAYNHGLMLLPSQCNILQTPKVLPEFSCGNTLLAKAARKVLQWPSTWKEIPTLIQRSGDVISRKIPGCFHYIDISLPNNRLIIQATDYEVFALSCFNPSVFGPIACSLDGSKRYFYIYDADIPLSVLAFRKASPDSVWASLLFNSDNTTNIIYRVSKGDVDFISNFVEMVSHNPRILAWSKRNLYRLAKYCFEETPMINFQESDLPKRKLPKHFGKLAQDIGKKLVSLQSDDIDLQAWNFWKSDNQKQDIGFFKSFLEMGKLSSNVNSFIDIFNHPPFDFLKTIFFEGSTLIVGLFSDFKDFVSNPAKYVSDLISDISLPSDDVPFFSLENIGLTMGVALANCLYDSNPALSLSLFFVCAYAIAMRWTSSKHSARKIATLFSLMFLCVMKAYQTLSAPISLQASTPLTGLLVSACAGIACLVAGVNTYGSATGIFEYLSKNTKDLLLVSRGTLSFVMCLEFIIDTIRKGVEFLVGDTALYKTLVKCSVTNEDLKKYIIFSLSKTPETLSTSLTMDENARKEWEQMCKLHQHFLTVFAAGKPPTENHIGYSMYSKAFNKFALLKEEYIKIKDSLDYFRPEPFMIWLWGSPGTGKTWCRDQLVNNLYRWHTKIDPTLPDARQTGLIYVRNPADKYMSNYVGQFAVAYDDVGQNRQADNPEFNEIMSIGSTNQVRLNMADLSEKGRLFSSKVVVLASNSQDVECNNLILKPDAFNRRRHIVVEVRRPQTTTDNLATSSCDFSQIALLLTNPRESSQTVARFPAEGYGSNETVWMDFYKWLAPKYGQHVQMQKDLLETKMKQLSSATKGLPSDMIYDYVPRPLEVSLEDPPINSLSSITTQTGEEVAVDMPPDVYGPPVTYARQLAFLKSITSKSERFRMACFVFPELYEASKSRDANPNPLTERYLKLTYKEKVKEELDDILLLTTLPVTDADPEHLAKAWEYYLESKEQMNFPWMKFFTWATIGTSLFGAYKLYSMYTTNEDPTLQAYSHDPLAPPTPKIALNRYEHAPQAPPTRNVVIHSTTQDLLPIYRKALFRVSCITGSENLKIRSVNFIQIAYNLFLAPKHFFSGYTNPKVKISNENTSLLEVVLLDSNITPLDKLDFVIVKIPELNYGKNIIQHFPTKDEIKSIVAFRSMVLSWNDKANSVVYNFTQEAKRWDVPVVCKSDDKEIWFPQGYKCTWESVAGDCGSMVIALDNACCSKIMGIHFGMDHSIGMALSTIMCRETLENYVAKLNPLKVEVSDPVVAITPGPCPEVLVCQSSQKPYFEYLGTVADAPSQPREHKNLFRSPAYGAIYPATKDLSVLSMNDSRLEEEFRGPPDILTRGVRDFAYNTRSWPPFAIDFGKNCLRYEFAEYTERIPKEVCSLSWAINGTWCGDTRVEYTEPLRLDTSAGYGLPGKKVRYFDATDPKAITISDKKLQSMVDTQWEHWMSGKTYPCIWTHAMKSEPLKMSKIVTGNTRTFCVAQTAFLLNVKRLFGAWITAMKMSKIRTFSCLGIDPESGDWTELYDVLRANSPTGIDMDFFKFDRTAVTWQLASAVVSEINFWYSDSHDNQVARFIAMDDMIHSYCLVGPHLTRKTRGNPSGNPITTELNNCVNFMMLSMVYALIARKCSPTDLTPLSFRRKIVARTYGDDIIFSVSLRDQDWFTPDRISKVYAYFGVPVTPADKSDSGLSYRPIEELTFLKRSFRPYPDSRFPWQAALSQDSIKSMIAFYRLAPNRGTVQEAVLVNMHQSLEFAHHWGEDFFNSHLEKLEGWLRERNWPPLAVSYDTFELRYRMKLGLE